MVEGRSGVGHHNVKSCNYRPPLSTSTPNLQHPLRTLHNRCIAIGRSRTRPRLTPHRRTLDPTPSFAVYIPYAMYIYWACRALKPKKKQNWIELRLRHWKSEVMELHCSVKKLENEKGELSSNERKKRNHEMTQCLVSSRFFRKQWRHDDGDFFFGWFLVWCFWIFVICSVWVSRRRSSSAEASELVSEEDSSTCGCQTLW